jgi:hypothetical protein
VREIIRRGSDALCVKMRTVRGRQKAPCSVGHIFDGGKFSLYQTGKGMRHTKEAIMVDPHDCGRRNGSICQGQRNATHLCLGL